MSINSKRMDILRRVEKGEISPDEASRFLEELEDDELALGRAAQFIPADEPLVEVIPPPLEVGNQTVPAEDNKRMNYWKRWWLIPFGVGVLIMVLGAYAMYGGYRAAGLSWGFWLSWLPFGLGVLIMALSAINSSSRWVHIRVDRKPGEKPQQIAISFPLAPAMGIFNIVNHFGVAKDAGKTVNEAFNMLNSAVSSDQPIHIQVNDEDGEHVEVFIG